MINNNNYYKKLKLTKIINILIAILEIENSCLLTTFIHLISYKIF